MDPFSISLGVITLVTLASKAAIELKKLRQNATESTTITAMLADIKALRAVLQSIEEGFEELDGSAPLTGHIGSHWSALRETLSDGCDSMNQLRELLVDVNKEVKYLDSIRRGRRMKEANDKITLYRQEIQAYKDTLQLSLQSVIFFQQATIKEDTSKILRSSDNMHHDLGRLAANLEVKLSALHMILLDRTSSGGSGTASVNHLRNCVKTAATVVTSASTIYAAETQDQDTNDWDFTSEFGWLTGESDFHSNLTLNWVVSQSQDQLAGQANPVALDITPGSPSQASTPEDAASPSADTVTNTIETVESSDLSALVMTTEADSAQGNVLQAKVERKRRNFSISRLFSPRHKQMNNAPRNSNKQLCMDDLKFGSTGEVPLKINFVGDGACGKTCFLVASSTGIYPEVYVPTVFENYYVNIVVQDVQFGCALWDTAGQEDYDRLRPLGYPDTHIFCICFAIDSPDSLEMVQEKWYHEIKHFKRKRDPIFLLGFKKDLRHDPKTIQELGRTRQTPVSTEWGMEVARKIGAAAYLESSAIRHEGTKETFETMLSMILDASPGFKKRYASGKWKRKAVKMLQTE